MPEITTLSGKTIVVDMQTRDFDGFRDAILGEGGLADEHTPNWTDRSELDVGVAIVEDTCHLCDNLAYYQDRCANEALWTSATQRRSVVEQAALIGYELRAATGASVALTVVTNGPATIPERTKVSTVSTSGDAPKVYEIETEFVAPGPGTYTGIMGVHGETVTEVFSSDASPSMRLRLSNKPLAIPSTGTGAAVVRVVEGGNEFTWEEVKGFNYSTPTSRHFKVMTDEDDNIDIVFGSGVLGKRPPSGTDNIAVTFRIGGGPAGNSAGKNTIVRLGTVIPGVVSVTNPEQPSGGDDKESIQVAKENAPGSLAALDRALSHEDYVALALTVPGVFFATASRGRGPLEEEVVIASKGENPVPSGTWDELTATGTGLLGAVGAFLEKRKASPTVLIVRAVSPVEIWLTVEVWLLPGSVRSRVQKSVDEALGIQLGVEVLGKEKKLPLSKVYEIVEEIVGVDYLNVLRLQRQPYFLYSYGSPLVDVSFEDIVVGALTPKDEWELTFISPTVFTLKGRSSGPQPNGTIGVTYSIPNILSFKVVGHFVPPHPGSSWSMTTGSYVGNVETKKNEAAYLGKTKYFISLKGGVYSGQGE